MSESESETRDRAAQRWHSDDPTTCLQRALQECVDLERKNFESLQRARADPQLRVATVLEAINDRLAQQDSAARPPLVELGQAGGLLRQLATVPGQADAAALARVGAWLDVLAKR